MTIMEKQIRDLFIVDHNLQFMIYQFCSNGTLSNAQMVGGNDNQALNPNLHVIQKLYQVG
jgi:hypothetical protein